MSLHLLVYSDIRSDYLNDQEAFANISTVSFVSGADSVHVDIKVINVKHFIQSKILRTLNVHCNLET